MNQLGETLDTMLKRFQQPGKVEHIPEERLQDLLYMKRQWLNDIKFQVRQSLGEECLTWNPSLCRELVTVEEATRILGGAVMLCGPVGTGKTTSAVHILLGLAERYAAMIQRAGSDLPDPDNYVMIQSAPHLFRHISQLYGNAGDQADDLIVACMRARLLLVDDLGTEGGSDDACAAFDEIMDKRYQNKRSRTTIIASNLMPDEWNGYRGGRFARLADRWKQDQHCIVLKGNSMRVLAKEAKHD